jgi:pSer/pThr/pTyr-binding forkhead associated (FHA) protein
MGLQEAEQAPKDRYFQPSSSESEMSRLIVLTPRGSVRQVNIQGPITTIGRDPTCGVQIDSRGVSRHHAAIRWAGDRFVVRDMNSRNGTFVNRARIVERALRSGDAIGVGDCQLRFLDSSRSLPGEDALRLVTVTDGLISIEAGQRSDWATFFRQGVARHAALRPQVVSDRRA